MAIYQPSNITPSSLAGLGEGVVDVNDLIEIKWQVNGNSALTAFKIDVFENTAASASVYSTGIIQLDSPFYGTDNKGNVVLYSFQPNTAWVNWGLINGSEYKFKITQYYGIGIANTTEQYASTAFKTRDNPTIKINEDLSTGIASSKYIFTANYQQTQNDELNWIRWQLYLVDSGEYILIDDTQPIYTGNLSYTYDGFLNGNTYAIKATIETENGQVATTGNKDFNVAYNTNVVGNNLKAEYIDNDNVKITYPKLSDIPAIISGSYKTQNNILELEDGSSATWDMKDEQPLSIEQPFKLGLKITNDGIGIDKLDIQHSALEGISYNNGVIKSNKNGDTLAIMSNGTLYIYRLSDKDLILKYSSNYTGYRILYIEDDGLHFWLQSNNHTIYRYTFDEQYNYISNISITYNYQANIYLTTDENYVIIENKSSNYSQIYSLDKNTPSITYQANLNNVGGSILRQDYYIVANNSNNSIEIYDLTSGQFTYKFGETISQSISSVTLWANQDGTRVFINARYDYIIDFQTQEITSNGEIPQYNNSYPNKLFFIEDKIITDIGAIYDLNKTLLYSLDLVRNYTSIIEVCGNNVITMEGCLYCYSNEENYLQFGRKIRGDYDKVKGISNNGDFIFINDELYKVNNGEITFEYSFNVNHSIKAATIIQNGDYIVLSGMGYLYIYQKRNRDGLVTYDLLDTISTTISNTTYTITTLVNLQEYVYAFESDIYVVIKIDGNNISSQNGTLTRSIKSMETNVNTANNTITYLNNSGYLVTLLLNGLTITSIGETSIGSSVTNGICTRLYDGIHYFVGDTNTKAYIYSLTISGGVATLTLNYTFSQTKIYNVIGLPNDEILLLVGGTTATRIIYHKKFNSAYTTETSLTTRNYSDRHFTTTARIYQGNAGLWTFIEFGIFIEQNYYNYYNNYIASNITTTNLLQINSNVYIKREITNGIIGYKVGKNNELSFNQEKDETMITISSTGQVTKYIVDKMQGTTQSAIIGTISLTDTTISQLVLYGFAEYSWLFVSKDTNYDLYNDGYSPKYNENMEFLALFSDPLNAGLLNSMYEYRLYRQDVTHNKLKYIGNFNLRKNELLIDYGTRSKVKYYYNIYMQQDNQIIGTLSQTDEICRIFNGYSLIEAKQDENNPNIYNFVQEFYFRSNVEGMSLTNNNNPTYFENFTGYRYRMPAERIGKTGTLTGLLGNVVNSKYQDDDIDKIERLFNLSTTPNQLFIKTPKGSLLMVHIASAITQSPELKSKYQRTNINVKWEETGSAEDITIIG